MFTKLGKFCVFLLLAIAVHKCVLVAAKPDCFAKYGVSRGTASFSSDLEKVKLGCAMFCENPDSLEVKFVIAASELTVEQFKEGCAMLNGASIKITPSIITLLLGVVYALARI